MPMEQRVGLVLALEHVKDTLARQRRAQRNQAASQKLGIDSDIRVDAEEG